MQVNNNRINSLHSREQTSQEIIVTNNSEAMNIKRNKIFFTAIDLGNNDVDISCIKQHSDIENIYFYDKIFNADFEDVKKYFIDQIIKLKELDDFYCEGNHQQVLNTFTTKIKTQVESNEKSLKNDLVVTLHSLYELNKTLINLQYEIQIKPSTTISKYNVSLRLDECIEGLDKCWPGIYTRLNHECEILKSMQHGLLGKIYLIKKDIFREVAIQYINKEREQNPEELFIWNEVHSFNSLNNLSAGALGLNNIYDKYATTHLDFKKAEDFIELSQIEVSSAKITYRLAQEIYDKLVDVLTKNSMRSWLTEDKTDSELDFETDELEKNIFIPNNMLFNVEANKKLTMDKILTITEIKTEENELNTLYSLKYSREKINLWVADSLMPNIANILVTDIFDTKKNSYFSIATIDYMFFWVCDQQHSYSLDVLYEVDYNNYMPLQLSHIQQIDFINFSNVDYKNHPCLFKNPKKMEVSISFVNQAMLQTNNVVDIINFLASEYIVKLNKTSLLLNTIYNILIDKLTNKYFFYDCQYTDILHNTAKIIKIKWLLFMACMNGNYNIINDCISFVLNNNKLNVAQKVDILQTKTLPNNAMSFILRYGYSDIVSKYINYILSCDEFTAAQKSELLLMTYSDIPGLSIALELGCYKAVSKYMELVLAYKEFTSDKKLELIKSKSIKGYIGLYSSLQNGHTKTISVYIRLVLGCKEFTPKQKLELIRAENINGCLGLYIVLQRGYYKIVNEYIRLVLEYKEFTTDEKLEFMKATSSNGCCGLYVALYRGNDKAVSEYIKLVLGYKEFTPKQKLELLKATSTNGICGLYVALEQGNDKAVSEYIRLVLECKEFTPQQKLELIKARSNNGICGLYVALEQGNDKLVSEYIRLVLECKEFTPQQKLELLKAKTSNGDFGLYIAFKKNYEEVISKYIRLILDYNEFTTEQKLELIKAINIDGNSGLYIALQDGYKKIVSEYIKLVLSCNKFTPEQKLEIIQAKAGDGCLGLYMALQEGNDKAVSEYINLVLCSDQFDVKQKLDLIKAENINNCSGLHIALQQGNDKAVSEYIRLVLGYKEFTTQQKLELLKAKTSNGSIGLYTALQHDNDKAVYEYVRLILTCNEFSVEQKLDLIQVQKDNDNHRLYKALKRKHGKVIYEYIKLVLNYDQFSITQKSELCRIANRYSDYKKIIKNSNLTKKEQKKILTSKKNV